MLKNILVPLDGSDYGWSAGKHAIAIARPYRATIHGVYAIDAKIINGEILSDLNVQPAVARKLYQDKGQQLLEELEEMCKAAGTAFQPVISVSSVTDLIRKTALDVKSELIVMGKKGVNARWSGPLLGSIAESVIKRSRRPVLLVPETYDPIESVYVAYDGGLVSIRALRFVADLCKHHKWQMCVVNVHDSEGHRKKLLNEAVEIAQLYGLRISTIGENGNVVERILNAVSGKTNGLISVGAYSSHLKKLILGSVSEEIMHKASQPVLVYRPLQT